MKVKVSFRSYFGVVCYRDDGRIQLWYGPGNRHRPFTEEPKGRLVFEARDANKFYDFYEQYCAYRGK